MGTSEKENAKTVRNSPTLIGAAVGSAGGPLLALVGTGLGNAATGFQKTEWDTINTSAALLLLVVNVAVLVMGLIVASRCASAGSPSSAEFAGALLATVPYVVYRAFSPCPRPAAGGILGSIGGILGSTGGIMGSNGELNKSMAPMVLYQMGGFRRSASAAAASAAAASAAAASAVAHPLAPVAAFSGGGARRM